MSLAMLALTTTLSATTTVFAMSKQQQEVPRIAAEALVYGEAEVGKNDENLFISVFCCNHHYL
ncbi:hypothetical protein CFP56_039596 [Quercus suber]|uniref:Uncharacterized protein n=1 Tax=Quercus suber TaxID=58331 RepID=A0AAW0IZR9_QUESU